MPKASAVSPMAAGTRRCVYLGGSWWAAIAAGGTGGPSRWRGGPALGDGVAGYYALCQDAGGGLDAVGQHMMARHMTELVGLLLRTGTDDPPPALHDGYGAARLQLIQSQLLKRLGDGDLSIGS